MKGRQLKLLMTAWELIHKDNRLFATNCATVVARAALNCQHSVRLWLTLYFCTTRTCLVIVGIVRYLHLFLYQLPVVVVVLGTATATFVLQFS